MPTALARLSVEMSFSPLLSSSKFIPLYEKHREDKPLPPKPFEPLSLISSGSESGFADSESAGWSNTFTVSSTGSSDTSLHGVPKIVVTSTTHAADLRPPHTSHTTLIKPKKRPTLRSVLAQLEQTDRDLAHEAKRVRRAVEEARLEMEDWRVERQAWRREIIGSTWNSPRLPAELS
ncbi:unnamed protein product [Peniophora sp. CBMAI 1063]|nr:unnamed protein product [Peniophora sp. CBMAI 1063]